MAGNNNNKSIEIKTPNVKYEVELYIGCFIFGGYISDEKGYIKDKVHLTKKYRLLWQMNKKCAILCSK